MSILRYATGLILALLVNTGNAAFVGTPGLASTGQAAGVIVKMRNDPTPLAIAQAGGQPRLSEQTLAVMKVVAANELRFKRTASLGAQVLNFTNPMSVPDAQAIADRLMAMPEVEFAEPNIILHPMLAPGVPDDPRFQDGTQWALDGVTAGANLPAAWDVTLGSSSVVVAVIDTGYTKHAELDATNFASDGYDFISDATVAGDGDSRDGDARDEGDYCLSNTSTSDDTSSWHGTAVMSIIGALTNNTTLMAGVNWNARMLPVRILGRCGGTTDDLIDAIRWAVGLSVAGVPDNPNPAKVINMSLGGVGSCGSLLQQSISAAHDAGAVIIAAAGNEALPASSTSPANCENVMAIAAHTISGDIAYFSNYGDPVALSAPGSNIYIATCSSSTDYVCDGDSAVATESGTSLSAPMVSGVASLVFSANSSLSNYFVEQILRGSARSFVTGSGCIGACGAGMLDAAAAVALANNFAPPAQQLGITQDKGGALSPVFWLGVLLLMFAYRQLNARRRSCIE
jgi:serine protease